MGPESAFSKKLLGDICGPYFGQQGHVNSPPCNKTNKSGIGVLKRPCVGIVVDGASGAQPFQLQ